MDNVKLYRSSSDRMIGGVCGGLGAYFNLDPIFFRLIFVVLLFGSQFGFILYLLLWILIPGEGKSYGFKDGTFRDKVISMGDDIQAAVTRPHPQAGLILGAGLIVVGGVMLAERLNMAWLAWLDFDLLWPVLLIAGGFALLFRQQGE